MQIRDRESQDETWPRRTPGPPPKRYSFLDARVRLAIAQSQIESEREPDDRIEELGEPVNEQGD